MSTKIDVTEPEGPEIESSVLLNFLVKRFREALASHSPKVPFLVQGLGVVALGPDKELLANYTGLLGSPHLPPQEVIPRCIDIFQLALDRDLDNPPPQEPSDQPEEDHEPDEKFCKRILMNAAREGKIMAEHSDYRFFRVFEMLAWIGLQSDAEWLAEFEQVRRRFATDPEEMIARGRDILRDALFKRRPSGRVLPHSDM